ncbi:hypothetical protein NDU88_007252 [Pleurodeles waltl]|uniref:Uncharacterized protein n=1 Tax=Pleurodeles waltl TaxID=8319 RepID=A0AAV7LUW3_PLEWA|nr:hypothetical protein NDU88_007252 [Pleurodeles waltl]
MRRGPTPNPGPLTQPWATTQVTAGKKGLQRPPRLGKRTAAPTAVWTESSARAAGAGGMTLCNSHRNFALRLCANFSHPIAPKNPLNE